MFCTFIQFFTPFRLNTYTKFSVSSKPQIVLNIMFGFFFHCIRSMSCYLLLWLLPINVKYLKSLSLLFIPHEECIYCEKKKKKHTAEPNFSKYIFMCVVSFYVHNKKKIKEKQNRIQATIRRQGI